MDDKDKIKRGAAAGPLSGWMNFYADPVSSKIRMAMDYFNSLTPEEQENILGHDNYIEYEKRRYQLAANKCVLILEILNDRCLHLHWKKADIDAWEGNLRRWFIESGNIIGLNNPAERFDKIASEEEKKADWIQKAKIKLKEKKALLSNKQDEINKRFDEMNKRFDEMTNAIMVRIENDPAQKAKYNNYKRKSTTQTTVAEYLMRSGYIKEKDRDIYQDRKHNPEAYKKRLKRLTERVKAWEAGRFRPEWYTADIRDLPPLKVAAVINEAASAKRAGRTEF